jgi:hypothetical protein
LTAGFWDKMGHGEEKGILLHLKMLLAQADLLVSIYFLVNSKVKYFFELQVKMICGM